MYEGKIFGIGFPKTGTSSLERALKVLGYRVMNLVHVRDPSNRRELLGTVMPLVPHHDAFRDNPWPVLYRELDRDWPNSKFILTTRPSERWIKSAVDHFGGQSTAMREHIYGVGYPRGNESVYVARYERHNAEVKAYFKDRPNDLLELRITEGEGWKPLCAFLDAPVPALPFPHANRAEARGVRQHHNLRARIKMLLRRFL